MSGRSASEQRILKCKNPWKNFGAVADGAELVAVSGMVCLLGGGNIVLRRIDTGKMAAHGAVCAIMTRTNPRGNNMSLLDRIGIDISRRLKLETAIEWAAKNGL